MKGEDVLMDVTVEYDPNITLREFLEQAKKEAEKDGSKGFQIKRIPKLDVVMSITDKGLEKMRKRIEQLRKSKTFKPSFI